MLGELSKIQERNEDLQRDHRSEAEHLIRQIETKTTECIELSTHLVSQENLAEEKADMIEELTLKLMEQEETLRCRD